MAIGVSLALIIIESVQPQMTVLWRLPNTPIYRNIKQESSGHFVPGVMVLRIGASMYFANVSFIRDYILKMVSEFSEAADTAPFGSAVASSHGAGLHASPAKASPGSPDCVTDATVSTTMVSTTVSASPVAANGSPASVERGAWIAAEPIKYIVIEMTPVTSVDSTAVHMLDDMHRDLKERGIRIAFSTMGSRVEDTLKRAGLIDKVGEAWTHPSVHSAVQHCIRHRINAALHVASASNATVESV